MAAADYRLMTDETGQRIAVALEAFQAVPYVATIPTGQWSGSGSDRYITVQASNVTANSLLVPHYDSASEALLNGPIWCVPDAGSFTIHTSAIPAGTVTVMVQLLGTLGEAQYQVLSDVYSKSQVDSIVAQSTARFGYMGFISKKTTSTSGTVVFNFSANRFTGLLFITNNGGTGGIYAVKFKAGGTGGLVTKLAGDIVTAPTIDSSGNLSVTMDNWSDATLLTNSYPDFS